MSHPISSVPFHFTLNVFKVFREQHLLHSAYNFLVGWLQFNGGFEPCFWPSSHYVALVCIWYVLQEISLSVLTELLRSCFLVWTGPRPCLVAAIYICHCCICYLLLYTQRVIPIRVRVVWVSVPWLGCVQNHCCWEPVALQCDRQLSVDNCSPDVFTLSTGREARRNRRDQGNSRAFNPDGTLLLDMISLQSNLAQG